MPIEAFFNRRRRHSTLGTSAPQSLRGGAAPGRPVDRNPSLREARSPALPRSSLLLRYPGRLPRCPWSPGFLPRYGCVPLSAGLVPLSAHDPNNYFQATRKMRYTNRTNHHNHYDKNQNNKQRIALEQECQTHGDYYRANQGVDHFCTLRVFSNDVWPFRRSIVIVPSHSRHAPLY